jgi:hypothetical protein
MPYNFFKEFKKACRDKTENVFPINNVLRDAKKYFKLHTKKDLLGFIKNNGLENLVHVNVNLWHDGPGEEVYDYHFTSMNILGYIAIVKAKKTGNWLIKSFHPDTNSGNKTKNTFQKQKSLGYRRIS